MKNVRVTNMDNGVSIVMSKEQFETCRTSLSENTVYEYTNAPLTKVVLARGYSKESTAIEYISKILGGFSNEVNRTTII